MGSTFDVTYDLINIGHTQSHLGVFAGSFLQTCLGVMDTGSFRKKKVIPTETPVFDLLKARGWPGHISAAKTN